MGNQQDPKTPMKGGGGAGGQQKGQPPKSGNKPGNEQPQQRESGGDLATGGSGTPDHGSTRSYGNDQERAGDSGQKSHE